MTMKYPPHPGRSILRDCIEPLGLSIADTAQKLGMSTCQLTRVIDGQASISLEMATALDKLFGGGASTWHQMQVQYDEAQERNQNELTEDPEPLVVYEQTATIPLEHGRVVYRTFDAEVISLCVKPSADPTLSDDRDRDRVGFRFVGEGPGAVQIQMIYQPRAEDNPFLVADVLFKTYLVWDATAEEYVGQIDANEWNRESEKLNAGKDEMNSLHASLTNRASGQSQEMVVEVKEESGEESYSDILREAEELLHKGTASVPATALAGVQSKGFATDFG